jgi:hypothetical protein
MPILKRLRNWFFQVTATLTNPGERFLKYDQPTEETYRNLFESVPFFLEENDRAKIDMQGLVHRSTDAEAKNYDETDLTTKTKAIMPYQLPEVKDVLQSIIGNITTYNGEIVNVRIASNVSEDINYDKRNVFIVELHPDFITWLENELVNSLTTTDIPGGLTGQVLTKNSNLNNDYSWQYPLPSGLAEQVLVRNSLSPMDYSWQFLFPSGNVNDVLVKTGSGQFQYSWQNLPYYVTFHVTQNPETFYVVMPFDVQPNLLYVDPNINLLTPLPFVILANTPFAFQFSISYGTEGVALFSLLRV